MSQRNNSKSCNKNIKKENKKKKLSQALRNNLLRRKQADNKQNAS